MTELQCLFINSSLYTILFIFFLVKYKWYNLSTLLSGLYWLNSIFGLLLYSFPFYHLTASASGTIEIESIIYMFSWYFILIISFSHISLNDLRLVTCYHKKHLYYLQLFLCSVLTIILLFKLPQSAMSFFSGQDLDKMRDATYGFQDSNKGFFLINVLSRFFGSTPIILLVLSCINILLFNSKDKIDRYSLIIYFLIKMNTVMAYISRATIIFSLLEIIVVLFLFHKVIFSKIKKQIAVGVLLGVIIFVPIFSDITKARFSNDYNYGMFDLSTLRYMGESQLNFSALAYPDLIYPFYGWGQFPLFRRVLGLSYDNGKGREDSGVTNTFIEKEFKYRNPTYIFHGLVGTWFFNWGHNGAFFFICLFFFFMKRKRVRHCISVSYLLTIVIMASYSAKGIFFSDYASESGNLLIVYIILLTLFFNKYGYKKRVAEFC